LFAGDSDRPHSFPDLSHAPFAPAPNWRLEATITGTPGSVPLHAVATGIRSYLNPRPRQISRAGDKGCLPRPEGGNLPGIRQKRLRFGITLIGLPAGKNGGLQDF